jgi:hypothetical protein
MSKTFDKIVNYANEFGIEIILADGYEDAIVGIGQSFNKYCAVYDYGKCIDILTNRDSMTYEEAVEYFEFNVVGSYIGENNPVFLMDLNILDN